MQQGGEVPPGCETLEGRTVRPGVRHSNPAGLSCGRGSRQSRPDDDTATAVGILGSDGIVRVRPAACRAKSLFFAKGLVALAIVGGCRGEVKQCSPVISQSHVHRPALTILPYFPNSPKMCIHRLLFLVAAATAGPAPTAYSSSGGISSSM